MVLLTRINTLNGLYRAYKTMPRARGVPIFGTLPELIAAGGATKLHEYIDKRHKELGPIFVEKLGGADTVFVAEAEAARMVFAFEGKYPRHILPEAWTLYNEMHGCKRGLFFMDGPEWLYYRRIMNEAMMKGDLEYLHGAAKVTAEDFVEKVRTPGLNLETTLYRWSLDTMVAALLGPDAFIREKIMFDASTDQLAKTVHLIFQTSAELQLVPAKLAAALKIKPWRNFVKSVDDTMAKSGDFVEELINTPDQSGLLDRLMNVSMCTTDVTKIVVDLILAAGDTTAYTMQWMLYMFAKHPELQDRVVTDDTFLRNFLRETLRLYPVAPFTTRAFADNVHFDGYYIPKDTFVITSLYTLGRDETYFKEPARFNPDRWLKTTRTPAMAKASIPFAMGTRSCVGVRLAEAQLKTTLRKVAERYRVELSDPSAVIDIVMKMVAVPSQPLQLKFIEK